MLGFDLIWLDFGWIWLDLGLISAWILKFRLLLLGFLIILGSQSSLGGPRTCYEVPGLATALIMDFLPFVTFPQVTFPGSHP